jgi:hypothetical protein
MTTITKRIDRFAEAEVDDEIVVMVLDKGEFFSLTGTGKAVWRLIDEQPDRTALGGALRAQFDVSEQQLSSDVDQFLTQLQGFGLIDES